MHENDMEQLKKSVDELSRRVSHLESRSTPAHWFSWRKFAIGFAIVWVGVFVISIAIGLLNQHHVFS